MNEELVFNPTKLDISRSKFNFQRPDKGTGFVGRLNTLRPIEVLPGSSWKLNAASLLRFTTPVNPTMDNLFCDVYAFYCASDMLLRRQSFSPSLNDGNHSFAAIMGAQDGFINMPFPDAGLQLPSVKYSMTKYKPSDSAQISTARGAVNAYTLLDQLGYPIVIRDSSAASVTQVNVEFSCLPLLGYISIWNENFREPNLQNRFALTISSGVTKFSSDYQTMCLGTQVFGGAGNSYGTKGTPLHYSGDLVDYAITFGVCRFHGLYGSLLPWPQRNNDPVYLPLGDLAPVIPGKDEHMNATDPSLVYPTKVLLASGSPDSSGKYAVSGAPGEKHFPIYSAASGGFLSDATGTAAVNGDKWTFSNLYADLAQATSASINTIRIAFQTQKWFEALARGGNSDLDEYISSLFGVVGPQDVESKRPVYLGGHRFPISISQVNNTGTNTGETGAFSLTHFDGHYVTYHSKTYGQIFFVFCVRHADSFADAPQKFLFKRAKFDFSSPNSPISEKSPITRIASRMRLIFMMI